MLRLFAIFFCLSIAAWGETEGVRSIPEPDSSYPFPDEAPTVRGYIFQQTEPNFFEPAHMAGRLDQTEPPLTPQISGLSWLLVADPNRGALLINELVSLDPSHVSHSWFLGHAGRLVSFLCLDGRVGSIGLCQGQTERRFTSQWNRLFVEALYGGFYREKPRIR